MSTAPEDPEHQLLRNLRDRFVDAYNRLDIEGMLSICDKDVAFTAMNAEVCHGHEGVRAYYDKMLKGPDARVRSTRVEAFEVDRLTTLYGGRFGVATGFSDVFYSLTDGLTFTARIRWTFTMIKQDNEWLIASMHTSTNIFDNPVLNMTRRAGKAAIGLCSTVGVLAGGLLGWLVSRK